MTPEQHAEAILRPLGYALRDGRFVPVLAPTPINNAEAILTAVKAAMVDAASEALDEAGNASADYDGSIRQLDPAAIVEGMK